MSYDWDNDPMSEPEDAGSFFRIPEGITLAEVKEVTFKKDDNGKLKTIEFKWYFDRFKDKTDFPTARSWFYVSGAWGRSIFTAVLENLGVPFETPDPSAVKKEDGTPRKTFIKALKNEMTGEFHSENLVGKKALITIYHAWKCPDCGIVNRMNLKACPAKKGEICEHTFDGTEKVYPQVDNTAIFSTEHLSVAETAAEIDKTLNATPEEKKVDESKPPF